MSVKPTTIKEPATTKEPTTIEEPVKKRPATAIESEKKAGFVKKHVWTILLGLLIVSICRWVGNTRVVPPFPSRLDLLRAWNGTHQKTFIRLY